MVHRSTLKTARTLLDRFFREAEGRTNHQLDVGFVLADLGLDRDRADPGVDYLVSRGLLNTFGPEVAFLTDEGVRASVEEVDIETLGPARSFGSGPSPVPPRPAPPEAEAPHLVHVRLDGETRAVPLGARCHIGRAPDSDIPIDDKRASKRHAEVRYERGGYVLEDLESANGTLLNGAYCVEPTRLSNDDEIVIGRTMLVFQAPASFPPPPGAEAPISAPRIAPSGAPTERPAPVAPDLADPRIRVVRGTPERDGPSSSPAALFGEPPAEAAEDVFGSASAGERLGPGPLGLGPDAVGADSPFELDLQEDLAPPEDLEPPAPAPTPVELDFADEEPTSVAAGDLDSLAPTLMGGESTLELTEPEEPLELSDVVEPRVEEPPLGPVPGALAEDDPTATMSVDVAAERLPLAPSALGEPDVAELGASPAWDATETLGAEGASAGFALDDPPEPSGADEEAAQPRFLSSLERLRSDVAAVAGPGPSPLLDAIDLLAQHPLVRAFAEDEDPER